MRAIAITEPGSSEVLQLQERPAPTPGPGQVRVKVAAAGVNRADILQRRGVYPAPPGAPEDVPGLEFSGTVDALGSGVRGVKEGDRVMGLVAGGAYADHVVLHHRELIPVPEGLDLVQAAAVPEAFATAWDAMHLQGGLSAGQAVLIHAVASGVGTAALQLACASGARTIGTSRTDAKLERCLQMGLDHAVNPTAVDVAEAAREAAPGGVDLVLDLVGASYLGGNLRALRRGGTMICVGLLGGAQGELNMGALLQKRITLRGTVLRSRPLEQKIALAQRFSRELTPLLERGALAPVVDRALPLEEAAAAHDAIEADATFGKVLLTL